MVNLRTLRSWLVVTLASTAVRALGQNVAADPALTDDSFISPSQDARPLVRWWWFGPAVTPDGVRREIASMKAGGFGGFEVQPTYPLSVDDPAKGIVNQKLLSAPFIDALKVAAAEAKQSGLRMDLTLGSGWPYGGPQISAGEGAGRLRVADVKLGAGQTRVNAPATRPGESILGAFLGATELELNAAGATLPAGATGDVRFFVASHTGMQVKRPALGGEGLVLGHLSPPVVGKFLDQVAAQEVTAGGDGALGSIFCDSLESYGEDWTDDLLEEFKKRRGYDLRPLLPALAGDAGPASADVRHDYGQTLTELFNDRFVKPLARFAHDHGTRFRIQAYGNPAAGLFSYVDADLPEGEGHQWRTFRASRYASSASHLMGRPVASSETFTWLHPPVFRATPLDIKGEADRHFLQGINQFVCHGWPYTPSGVPAPGWSFYASAVFNENNPWYPVMPDVNAYLARASHILRQGVPANDVAVYLANDDAWAGFAPGRASLTNSFTRQLGPDVIGQVLDAGFNLDFFDDAMLERFGRVDGAALAFGDVRYKAVVLAGVERMPLATLRKLDAFARAGGVVIATRRVPDRMPGHVASDADRQQLQALSRQLFSDANAPGHLIPEDGGLGDALASRLVPDVRLSPASPLVGFVHRRAAGTDIYFLANTGNTPVSVAATFRTAAKACRRFDAVNGRFDALVATAEKDAVRVPLELEPYGSTVLLFTDAPAAPTAAATSTEAPATEAPVVVDLSRDWSVKFGPTAAPTEMAQLTDWTAAPATRAFSGVATYERQVALTADQLRAGAVVALDFGVATPLPPERDGPPGSSFVARLATPIREAAVVYVNGKRLGSVWCPPYRIDVTRGLVAGENAIRVDVANTAVNALAATGFPNYDMAAITAAFGRRFDAPRASAFTAEPSGLLGPVSLRIQH